MGRNQKTAPAGRRTHPKKKCVPIRRPTPALHVSHTGGAPARFAFGSPSRPSAGLGAITARPYIATVLQPVDVASAGRGDRCCSPYSALRILSPRLCALPTRYGFHGRRRSQWPKQKPPPDLLPSLVLLRADRGAVCLVLFFFEFFVRRTNHSEVSGCATKATCPCLVIALTDAVLHLVGRRRIWGQTLSMLVFFSFFLSFLRSLFLSFFLSFDSIRRRYRGGFEFSPAVFADALRG